ncbi:MAG: hypothetical protein IPH35_24140 [Rhodoferax sp.]|nr:hypothetical protein [Rhodoferax sp.]
MTKKFRICFENYESSPGHEEIVHSKEIIMNGLIERPVDVFNFGLSHGDQIKLLHDCLDAFLKEQIALIDSEPQYCPKCKDIKLRRNGKRVSDYHDVFTDHKLEICRMRCPDCKYESGSTIQGSVILKVISKELWYCFLSDKTAEFTTMTKKFRICFESYESNPGHEEIVHSKEIIMNGLIEKPVDVFNFGLSHGDQIKLVHDCLDAFLKEQIALIYSEPQYCPKCTDIKLSRNGKRVSDYHDVFTDHKLEICRMRCPDCKFGHGSKTTFFAEHCSYKSVHWI